MDLISTNLGMNGEGVGKIDGKVYLVDFLLSNENAEIEIVKDFKTYSKAKIKKLIKVSPDRVTPPCPYYYECGGCALQHMNYKTQLEFKTELIKNTIKKIAGIDVVVNPCVASENQYGYRNKISFNVKDDELGFFKTNSHEIVEIDLCLLTKENINKILSLFKSFLKGSLYKNKIKHLVVREIENQILVGVVASENLDLNAFLNLLQHEFNSVGLYLVINNRNDSVVLSGKTIHIGGIKEIEINNFGLKYFVDLLGFHQINENVQNKIYNHVLELVEPNENVVNGFSGAGLLSAIISKKANQVYGIEINKSSHFSAEKLKNLNKIVNLTNIYGDFNKEIKKINKFNTLILDPSKKGCGEQVLKEISAEKIIYISCNPIALSKDLRVLEKNYIIKEITPYDMFPNTNQVETLVYLEKK